MSRRFLYQSLPVVVAILGAAYLWNGGTAGLSAQRGNGNFPNFVGLQPPAVTVVTSAQGAGPGVRFTAELDRNTQLQPPFEVVALRLASFELVKTEMSPAYSQACALTNSNTMLDCTLLPDPGPGWENGNPLFVRVRLTATDGHSDVQLVNLSTGGAGTGTILAQLNAGTGPSPATTNGTPVYLVTTLSRGVSGQSPFDSSALELASFELAAADFSPGFASACVFSNANTLLECALTPSPGPTWSAGGPMSVRVHVSAVDGTGATQLVSLRIN